MIRTRREGCKSRRYSFTSLDHRRRGNPNIFHLACITLCCQAETAKARETEGQRRDKQKQAGRLVQPTRGQYKPQTPRPVLAGRSGGGKEKGYTFNFGRGRGHCDASRDIMRLYINFLSALFSFPSSQPKVIEQAHIHIN